MDHSGCPPSHSNVTTMSLLFLTYLYFFSFVQSWGNFLYDYGTGTTHLIDFGAAREYNKKFVDGYLRIVWANANQDRDTLLDESVQLGFLTGMENDIMMEAHVQSGFVVGEPFQKNEPFDFKTSDLTARLGQSSAAFLKHRLK
jgi:aarF domain-containing kinase